MAKRPYYMAETALSPTPDPAPRDPETGWHVSPEDVRAQQRTRTIQAHLDTTLSHLDIKPEYKEHVWSFLNDATQDEEQYKLFLKWLGNPTRSPSGKLEIATITPTTKGQRERYTRQIDQLVQAKMMEDMPLHTKLLHRAIFSGSIGKEGTEAASYLRTIGSPRWLKQVRKEGTVVSSMRIARALKGATKAAVTTPLRAVGSVAQLPVDLTKMVLGKQPPGTGWARRWGREFTEAMAGFGPYFFAPARTILLGYTAADLASMTKGALKEQLVKTVGGEDIPTPRTEEALQFGRGGGILTPATKGLQLAVKLAGKLPALPDRPGKGSLAGRVYEAVRGAGKGFPEEAISPRWLTGSDAALLAVIGASATARGLRAAKAPGLSKSIREFGKVVKLEATKRAGAKGELLKFRGEQVLRQLKKIQGEFRKVGSKSADTAQLQTALMRMTEAVKRGEKGGFAAVRRIAAALEEKPARIHPDYGVTRQARIELEKAARASVPEAYVQARYKWQKMPTTRKGLLFHIEEHSRDWGIGKGTKGARVPRRIFAERYIGPHVKVTDVPKYQLMALASIIEDAKLSPKGRVAMLQRAIQKRALPAKTSLTADQVTAILTELKVPKARLVSRIRAEASLDWLDSQVAKKPFAPKGMEITGTETELTASLGKGLREGLKFKLQKVYGPGGERVESPFGKAYRIAVHKPQQYRMPQQLGEVGKGALEQVRALDVRELRSAERVFAAAPTLGKLAAKLKPASKIRAMRLTEALTRKDIPKGKLAHITRALRERGGDEGKVVAAAVHELRSIRQELPLIRQRAKFGPRQAVDWVEGYLEKAAEAYKQAGGKGAIPKGMFTGHLRPRTGKVEAMPIDRLITDYIGPMRKYLDHRPFLLQVREQLRGSPNMTPSSIRTYTDYIADVLVRQDAFGKNHPVIQGSMDIALAAMYAAELKLNLGSVGVNATQTFVNHPPTAGWETAVRVAEKFVTDKAFRAHCRDLARKGAALEHTSVLTFIREIGRAHPKLRKAVRWGAEPKLFSLIEGENRAMAMGVGEAVAKNFFKGSAEQVRFARVYSDLNHFAIGRGFRPDITRIRTLRPLTALTTFPSGEAHLIWNEIIRRGYKGLMKAQKSFRAGDKIGVREGLADIKPLMDYAGVVGTVYATSKLAQRHGIPLPDALNRLWYGGMPGFEWPPLPLVPILQEKVYGVQRIRTVYDFAFGGPKAKAKASSKLLGKKGDELWERIIEGEAFMFPGKRQIGRMKIGAEQYIRGRAYKPTGKGGEEVLPEEALMYALAGLRSSRQVAEREKLRKGREIPEAHRVTVEDAKRRAREAFTDATYAAKAGNREKRDAAMKRMREALREVKKANPFLDARGIWDIIHGTETTPKQRLLKGTPRAVRRKVLEASRQRRP